MTNQHKQLDATEIEKRIPHSGNMSLLTKVLSWHDKKIICESDTHLSKNNPLRHREKLNSIQGIEYAGQAIALHNSLINQEKKQGYLASVKNITIHQDQLDTQQTTLTIIVEQLFAESNGSMYSFVVSAGDSKIIDGKILVMI